LGAEALGVGALGAGAAGDVLGGALTAGDALDILPALAAGGGSSVTSAGIGLGDILGAAKTALPYASNLYGLSLASKMRKASDPFSVYREGYGRDLAALEANPASITSRPGYQAGLQAVQRGSAAGGYLGSGNEIASLSQFGGNFYQSEMARLASLAGAGATPGAGSVAAANLAGQSLAGLGYSAAGGSGLPPNYTNPYALLQRYGYGTPPFVPPTGP
jgi:hypothetical protein